MVLPEHVGIILDGNRRWAREKGKKPWEGHRAGAETVKKVLEHADKIGIKHVTLYTWSLKNNAERSGEERDYVFKIFVDGFQDLFKEAKKRKTRVQFLGRWQEATSVKSKIAKIIEETKDFTDKSLNLCFMYDGQEEIVDACNFIIKEGLGGVTVETFKEHLYTKHLPPMDLLIRTGMADGKRLSGFMLWDASYSELIFHDTYWPDYSPEMLDQDLEEFNRRNRRFGK